MKSNDEQKREMKRRDFMKAGLLGGAAVLVKPFSQHVPEAPFKPSRFNLGEVSVLQLQEWMESGKETSASIVEQYLQRIKEIDRDGPGLNSVIEINPDAEEIARARDMERKSQGPRGPMHGIPVLIKDNLDTHDKMNTTAGSWALYPSIPASDSFVVSRLRDAGAVILGKTNLSEWANFRSSRSTSGWSGRGGQTKSPYALDRNPCGSSSGSGVAVSANLCSVAIGTETDGSIVCPSCNNGIVGIKPTVGLVSRSGIVPISHTQDTAGPMARTVTDAAILLGAIVGVDANDPATRASKGKGSSDYTKFLDPKGLKGARIGVARKFFGFNDKVDKLMNEAIAVMKQKGAVIVDPADLPSHGKFDDSEFEAMLYEFKADLNKYLASLPVSWNRRTLKDLIDYNSKHADEEMPYFGQELFLKAEEKGPLTSKKYKDALAKNLRLSRKEGIDAVMDKHKLDAIVAPTGGPAWTTDLVNGDHFTGGSSSPAAVAGYPNINVPVGDIFGLPVGISFFGRAWSEPVLIKIAYAYEQATKHRIVPRFLPTADLSLPERT